MKTRFTDVEQSAVVILGTRRDRRDKIPRLSKLYGVGYYEQYSNFPERFRARSYTKLTRFVAAGQGDFLVSGNL